MSGKQIVRELNSEIDWLESQAGRPVDRAGRDRVENLVVTALVVLSTSPNWPNYRRWIRRAGRERGIRQRQKLYVTAKWSKVFCKLLRLAVSDLEALPGRELPGVPIGRDLSEAQLRRLEKARLARWNGHSAAPPKTGSIETGDLWVAPLYSGFTDPIKQGV